MSGATGLQPGAIFAGDFEIVRPLSSGGMGAVYVAKQLSTGRERALKVMLGELLQNDDLRKRFAQEARIGASIESDHIVEVVGAGIDAASGSPWLAMELLHGEDLASRLAREGALPPPVVLALFEQIVHAIGAAHRKGIVHRDLKPENLFLAHSRRSGEQSIVKVLDFGIAKLLGAARTKATGAMGTPLWMAPEQTQAGKGVTAAADVWALGLIAFRALTGHAFWKAATDADSSPMMVLREVVMEPIPPASARAAELRAVQPPMGFDAWFARCAAREPADRFQDAAAMFEALRPVLSGQAAPPISAHAQALGAQATLVADPRIAPYPASAAQPASAPPALAHRQATPAPLASMATDAPQVRTLAPSPRRGPPWLLIGGGVGAAAAAALAVVFLTGSSGSAKASKRDEKGEVRANKAERREPSVASAAPPAPRPPLPEPNAWATDVAKAREQARVEHRRVLIHFSADWCAACQELVKHTFADASFRAGARDLIPVRVDCTDEESAAVAAARREFAVAGLPLVLLLDENGDELARIEEFIEPARMLEKLMNPGPPRPLRSLPSAPAAAPPPINKQPLPYDKPAPQLPLDQRPANPPPKFTPQGV